MTQEELRSYRLTSMEEPTDEMLQAIMEQVAESARRSTAKFQAEKMGSRLACWDSGRPTKQALFQMPFSCPSTN